MHWIVAAIVLVVGAVVGRRVFTPPTANTAAAQDRGSVRVPLLMRIPVPWMYLLTFLVGVGLQRVAPLSLSATTLRVGFFGGLALIVVGVLLAFSGLGIFRAARTTTIPFETASTLVTWGPYRFTRNPMYLGLMLVYVGVAGVQAQVWPLIVLPWLAHYIHGTVIPIEEARLRDVFGASYHQYCEQVRRWI
jgi:protein-S-isoprenylcysteine O-methyltransferase Ste14